MKHLHKSFARGILSPNVLTRTNVPGYDEAARELFNIHIGRQGEAYKRGGLGIMARLGEVPARIIPFKTSEGPYLIVFTGGRITNNNSSDLVNSDSIVVFPVKDWEINKKDVDFSSSDFYQSQVVKVYGKGAESNIDIWSPYWEDIEDGYTANELKSMDYAQLGNVIVFCGESFPPFIIRKEDENFVFYRNFMDMLVNGDQSENKQKSLEKSIKTLPFNFYGYGVNVYRSRYYNDENYDAFLANLNLKENYDQNGLARRNLRHWTNRAFIVSTFDENQTEDENAGIQIFGGIIKNIKIISNIEPSQYRISGFIKSLNGSRNIDFEWTDAKSPNLHLCDWSEELGWPASVTVYENRFIFGGNKAFPSKIWYSAQPSIQKVQKGTKETVSYATAQGSQTDRVQSRTITPITQTLYFEQTDFFSIDLAANGLLPLQPATPGNLFINDNLGFKILWVTGGEVLFIGTDIGIFVSRGTIVDSSNPVPFNSGFQRPVEVPVKRTSPILIDEALYFISQDNSLQVCDPRGERMGFVTQTLDNFSRETIRDVWIRSQITKSLPEQDILAGSEFISGSTITNLTKTGTISARNGLGMGGNVTSGVIFGGHDGTNRLNDFYKYEISGDDVTITSLTKAGDTIAVRDRMGMVGDISSGIIYGGYNGSDNFNDFYKYEVSSNNITITALTLNGNITGREFMGMGGDVTSGIIFGGYSRNSRKALNNFYKYEVSNSSINVITLPVIGNGISIRSRMGVAGDVVSGIIFGGASGSSRYNDFYKYEVGNNNVTITPLSKTGDNISNRNEMGMVGNVNSGLIFGGYSGSVFLNDLFKYEVNGNVVAITKISATGSVSARNGMGMVGDVNSSIVFGGWSEGNNRLNDFNKIVIGTGENSSIQNSYTTYSTYSSGFNPSGYSSAVISSSISGTAIGVPIIHDASSEISKMLSIFICGLTYWNYTPHRGIQFFNHMVSLYTKIWYKTKTVNSQFAIQSGPFDRCGLTSSLFSKSSGSYREITEVIFWTPNGMEHFGERIGNDIDTPFRDITGNSNVIPSGSEAAIKFNPSDAPPASPQNSILTGSGSENLNTEPLNIQLIVNVDKTYPVFNSNTRLLFDWSRRILFLMRDGLPYLALAKNKETGVMGWSRGDMSIQDAVFLNGLPFRPPEIFSTVFGIRGNNIVMLSQGLHSYKENFINSLPNGVDDFIVMNKDSETINLATLKESLKRLGYSDDDLVIVATNKGIIKEKVTVSELSGSLDGIQGEAFIVGKIFGFHLKTWQPLTGRMLGEQFNITQIVYNAIKNSEFLANNNYVLHKENVYSNAEINGNEFIKQVVQTKLDFDPTIEIKGDSPFPFAISGYVIFIPKGR